MSKIGKAPNEAPLSQEVERGPVHGVLRVAEIREEEEGVIEANAAELIAIAQLLDLVALDRVAMTYRLQSLGGGRIGLSGRLEAIATQTCVVTLAPVPAKIDGPVEIEFWPLSRVKELEARAADPANHGILDWPEPIIDGKIDLGPVLYESLATSLDPYPRVEGAAFAWPDGATDPNEETRATQGPFAALAKLKRR